MPPRIRLPSTLPAAGARAAAARRPLFTTPVRGAAAAAAPAAPAAPAEEDRGTEAADNPSIDNNKKARDEFLEWIRGPGVNFKKPLYNEMNYITSYDRKTWQRASWPRSTPFPLNPHFFSHPVLSEELRDEIHRRVMVAGRSVRSVSAELGVSLERVAAVVRLKEVEKQWVEQGKPLATYLTKALHSMLPVTPLSHGTEQKFHEGLQDMVSHPFSHRQAFVPVSESRVFTRADAGEVFGLPPTEEAVPHPDLVVLDRERSEGLSTLQRVSNQIERDRLTAARRQAEEVKQRQIKKRSGTIVEHGRWAWRLKKATTGEVGFRYGVPHEDRKKGQVKIPTCVE